ncbi:FHA domain-containing protein [Streptomyces albus]|uniref:FHA domain-containing protein n=1 Tax=Streptomyces albus TaxID=1888 RepID=UPI0004C4B3A6|nr:FHA domain-containing protein [Streptomyces albus]
MQIRLTVLGPLSGHAPRSCDVLVTAPAGTALAAVAGGLAATVAAGAEPGRGAETGGPGGSVAAGARSSGAAQNPSSVALYAGSERLDGRRCVLGEPPLVDGAVLSLHAPVEPGLHPGIAQETAARGAARLHVVAGPDAGGVHLLHGGQIRIGRSADADVPLDDPDVSRLHCAVTLAGDGRVTVADLGSTNGTAVDGAPVDGRSRPLPPGALLRVGESALRLESAADAGEEPPAAPAGAGAVRRPAVLPGALPVAPDGEGRLRVEPPGAPGAGGRAPDGASRAARATSPAPAPAAGTTRPGGGLPGGRPGQDGRYGSTGGQAPCDPRERAPGEQGRPRHPHGGTGESGHALPGRGEPGHGDAHGRGEPGYGEAGYSGAGYGAQDPSGRALVPGQRNPGGDPDREPAAPGEWPDGPREHTVTGHGGTPLPCGRPAGETRAAEGSGAFRGPERGDAAPEWPPSPPEHGTVRPGVPAGAPPLPAYAAGRPASPPGEAAGEGPDRRTGRRGRGIGAWARRLAGGRAEEEPAGTGRPADPAAPSAAAAAALHRRWPDPSEILLTALGPGPRLWERGPGHPDALVVRLGTADRAGVPAFPVTVGLRQAGSLGLAGPRARLAGLARSVVAQLAALHSPATLELVLISADPARELRERMADWAWLGWLPQLRPAHGQDCRLLLAYDHEQAAARIAELARQVEEAPLPGAAGHGSGSTASREDGSYTVVVLDGDPGSPELREATARLAGAGPAAGVHLLCAVETPAASPAAPLLANFETARAVSPAFGECGAVAMLSGEVATALRLIHLPADRPGAYAPRGPADAAPDAAPAAAPDARTAYGEHGPGVPYGTAPGAAPGTAGPGGPRSADPADTHGLSSRAVAAERAPGGRRPAVPDNGTAAVADAVSAAWAERFARSLAPLRLPDAGPGASGPGGSRRVAVTLPRAARLLDELGLARATPASLTARWAAAADPGTPPGGRLCAVLGAGPHGPLTVDVAAEGPHLLVEGGAGSGKTELLRSLAASLAAADRPDRLAMALVDGGGLRSPQPEARGEGLRACTDLPHVTTYVTGVDPVRMRAFAQALSSELKRRAELLDGLDFAEWHARRSGRAERPVRRTAERPGGERRSGDPEAESGGTLQLRVRGAGRPWEHGAPAAGNSPGASGSSSGSGPGGGGALTGTVPAPAGSVRGGASAGAEPEARAAAGPEALPRLVVLVDDFDALLSPALGSTGRPAAGSVVRALEAVAREGARLGVHLVAASGHPERTAGTAAAEAAGVRVALEVLPAVTDGPEKAEATAGRGRLTGRDGAVVWFQAGRVTGRIPRTATQRPTVVPLDWERMGDPPARRPLRELGNGPTDLALLASALQRAAESADAAPAPPLV